MIGEQSQPLLLGGRPEVVDVPAPPGSRGPSNLLETLEEGTGADPASFVGEDHLIDREGLIADDEHVPVPDDPATALFSHQAGDETLVRIV